MISIEKLDNAILELESRDTTFTNCSKLADLYICRDHINGYSSTPASEDLLGMHGDSEFMQMIAGKDSVRIWEVMDELVSSVEILLPRLYNALIDKIQDI